jgi:hypothetical protein
MPQPPPCPNCGSKNVVDIIYGLPTYETFLEAEAGKFHLGGCIVTGNDPQWHCNECGNEWGKIEFEDDEE